MRADRPLSVLVVDDHADCAESTAELLTLWGHRPRVAGCGADALSACAAEVPDVVLLEHRLPGLDGWALVAWLRANLPGKQPLIVAVTARGDEEEWRRSAAAGVDLHVVKPVDPAALAGLLDRVGFCCGGQGAECRSQHPHRSFGGKSFGA